MMKSRVNIDAYFPLKLVCGHNVKFVWFTSQGFFVISRIM